MNFEGNQKKFVNSKAIGFQVIKGALNTGKTTAAIYRTINLANNFCIYGKDKIAVITSTGERAKEAQELYNRAKIGTSLNFLTLFSSDEDKVQVYSIEDIISIYSNAYLTKKNPTLRYVKDNEKSEIVKLILIKKKEEHKKLKSLKSYSIEFILEEIEWIKAAALSLEEYLEVERKCRMKRIRKNSQLRAVLYEIFIKYNKILVEKGLMDEYDQCLFAIKETAYQKGSFSHIVVDDCESFTKGELNFIKKLYKNRAYSSFVCILNHQVNHKKNAWLIKGRKINSIGFEAIGKTYCFKNSFKCVNDDNYDIITSIENYQYIDLKHRREYDFFIDTASFTNELLIEDDNNDSAYVNEELLEIPVYSDIAAGEPILISEGQEGSFYLPKTWFKGAANTFILHIKGDSMENANINDGDLVVIKKQQTAVHNDIVAIDLDGNATLKRLNLKEKIPYLMPENPKYLPISLVDKEAAILGIAVGVIKRR